MNLHQTFLETPIGRLRLVASDRALVALHFPETSLARDPGEEAPEGHAVLAVARKELTEYFAGKRQRFEIPLEPRGTAFQLDVWQALRDIALGETASYAALAARLGRATAARAVGAANGRNPISVIVPCHRVIGADGSLTGYAGGLARKGWLLEHERRMAERELVGREPVARASETSPELSCI